MPPPLGPILPKHIIRIKIHPSNPLLPPNPTKRTRLPRLQRPIPRARPDAHIDVEIHPRPPVLRATHHAGEDVRGAGPGVADGGGFAFRVEGFGLVEGDELHAAAAGAGGGGPDARGLGEVGVAFVAEGAARDDAGGDGEDGHD